jgi:hypothetical protein
MIDCAYSLDGEARNINKIFGGETSWKAVTYKTKKEIRR